MGKTRDTYLVTDPWKIVEEGFHPDRSRVSESLFSIGNEYQGVRGYFEEGYSGDSLRGCYLNGIWEEHRVKEPLAYKGLPLRTCFMVNTVDWLYMRLEIDGETLDLDLSRFAGFRRELDFRTGMMRRELIWSTRSGRELRLVFTRLLGMRTPELALQRIAVTPLNFSGALSLTLGLDFGLIHEAYGENFWECPRKGQVRDSCAILGVSREMRHALFAGCTIFPGTGVTTHHCEDEQSAGFRIALDLKEGRERSVDRASVLCAGERPHHSAEETWARGMELIAAVDRSTFEDTVKGNTEHWKALWDSSDITIEGDPHAQQGIRFCIFQLHQTCRGALAGAHIGAKGLTGEAYNGNAFWDSEIYCLPYYLFSNPSAARSLIEFRARTLPQAMDRARELDCEGACYPVATIDGSESCTLWQHANLQIQTTTAVAYAIRHYCQVTEDLDFLFGSGAELLIPICRFLASRGQWSPLTGGFGYYGVMGPDEFHMMVNNNFYTNYMAKETLIFTLKVLADMGIGRPERKEALLKSLGCTEDEQEEWRKKAQSMILPRDPVKGIYEQHEGFFDLPHIDVDSIPPGEFPLYAHWSYDRIFRTDMIKQPEVLMLMLLHNASFTAAEKKANYDFYTPRCIHESSLSPSVHSILASETGRAADAFSFFKLATRIDLDDCNRNTAEGLHLTSLAAAWMNIVYGFGGMRSDGEVLALDPTIPDQWKGYRFQITYRGSRLGVEVSREQARVRLQAGPPVSIVIRGETRQVTAEGFALTNEACSP